MPVATRESSLSSLMSRLLNIHVIGKTRLGAELLRSPISATVPPNHRGNDMRIFIAAVAVVLLAGCASSHVDIPKPHETQECMTYRSMMTAPMAPDAMQRLKAACGHSRYQ